VVRRIEHRCPGLACRDGDDDKLANIVAVRCISGAVDGSAMVECPGWDSNPHVLSDKEV
jgi:hypothetical protein